MLKQVFKNCVIRAGVLPYDTTISHLGIYPTEGSTYPDSELFVIALYWKQPNIINE